MAYIFYGTPLIALAPATLAFGTYFPWLEDAVWDYCMWSVVKLGPTFIKMAQWVSAAVHHHSVTQRRSLEIFN